MPYHGGLEDNEHLKQQAADAQRRAQQRVAARRAEALGGLAPLLPQPWWAFWRRWQPSHGAHSASEDTSASSSLYR